MNTSDPTVIARIQSLERSRTRSRCVALVAVGAMVCLSASRDQDSDPAERLVVRELVVVDSAGTPRVRIGSDGEDSQRRAKAVGITIFDQTGAERGGMSTFEDGSVVLALDAPTGVGAPMRDRAAMIVQPDGGASIELIDNRTMIPVRLASDAEGGGGLEFLDYDVENRRCTVIRQSAAGREETEHELGG